MTTLDERVDQVVRYLLLVDEAPFTASVAGGSSFTRTFPARGPRDAAGGRCATSTCRRRLFRHPLSYLIYSHDLRRAARRRAGAGLPCACTTC